MGVRRASLTVLLGAILVGSAPAATLAQDRATTGPFQFQPVAASATCTVGGDPAAPLVLPDGYRQRVIASEPDFPDLPDMNTLNETGPEAGRYLYRPHEVRENGSVSVTDLATGQTRILAQRADWERLDGIVWTPWRTLLTAEEVIVARRRDPQAPDAVGGLVYELDPQSGAATVRPAIGSRSHEGLRFDSAGNLYGISERSPGHIFKFTPDRPGDLSSGQLYALKIVRPTGDRTGDALWVPLDRALVQVDSAAAAAAVGATGYSRPEDVEIATSTGNNRGGAQVLYVAITGEDRVLAVDLRQPAGSADGSAAFVSEYVRAGGNAPADFESPDNLALDKNGNLYIAEDPGGSAAQGKTRGDDIWVAVPAPGNPGVASTTVRFASLTDCEAEPTGIYFDLSGTTLFVNVMHRGGDGRDLALAVTRER